MTYLFLECRQGGPSFAFSAKGGGRTLAGEQFVGVNGIT